MSSSETACDSRLFARSLFHKCVRSFYTRRREYCNPVTSPKEPSYTKSQSKFYLCQVVTNEAGLQLNSVMQLQGCQPCCAAQVHGFSEYDVLVMHSAFASRTTGEKHVWLLDYFANNCPNTPDGVIDPKHLQLILCARNACQALWHVRARSSSLKSLEARSYFDRVGDK